jgi:plasmid stabilization system protein ParE
MSRYIISAEAATDIEDIWSYIASDNEDAADRLLHNLWDAMDKLVDFPGKGHVRLDLASDDVRFWPVSSYLIVYRARTPHLQIIAVLHGARDIPLILAQR